MTGDALGSEPIRPMVAVNRVGGEAPYDAARASALDVKDVLQRHYGPSPWRRHGDPVDELVGTVLSQHTSDVNTARSFAALKRRYPSWDDVISAPTDEVADAIRCGGLANVKAPRIQLILRQLKADFGEVVLDDLTGFSVTRARAQLERLPGVGPKTASCVLLFALGMAAVPVDTHVHRVASRVGLIPVGTSAEKAHLTLEEQVGSNRDDAYAFHMLMIRHGRKTCTARRPDCPRCVLAPVCNEYTVRYA